MFRNVAVGNDAIAIIVVDIYDHAFGSPLLLVVYVPPGILLVWNSPCLITQEAPYQGVSYFEPRYKSY
jgi:hypothetical protein